MKSIRLGKSSVACSRLAYGCWRIAGTPGSAVQNTDREAAGRAAVIAAYEAGYTLFDHADIYSKGLAETIFGQVLSQIPGMRERVVIATKCGVRRPGEPGSNIPYRYDFSREHILDSCEGSLKRMGVDCIDLYMLHRPDYLMEPEEVAAAFAQLKEQGKVREFGVSNFLPSQLLTLQSACPMPLIANQVEISLWQLDRFNDGTLDQCVRDKIVPLAWSPLAGGRLVSTVGVDMQDPEHARKFRIADTLDALARDKGVSRVAVALAWLMRAPAGIVPIVGSTNPDHIRAAALADTVGLSREEWYRLMEAAHGRRLP